MMPHVRGAWIILVLWLLIGCAATRTSENQGQPAQFRNYTFHPPARVTTPPPWPSFSAEDYRTFHGKLDRSEVALIRKTLSLVKPCQRSLVRFAFPSDGGTDFPFVVFFQGSAPFEATHALWTHNMFYDPHNGDIVAGSGPVPKWNGIQFEVNRVGCDGTLHL